MVEVCAGQFDYVLIDTPPLESVADALRIATHADGVVLVVRSGRTSRKLVADAAEKLRRTGAPILGVVLSRAEMDRRGSRYYKRYYYNGYYSKGYGHKPRQAPNCSQYEQSNREVIVMKKKMISLALAAALLVEQRFLLWQQTAPEKTALCRLTRIRTS